MKNKTLTDLYINFALKNNIFKKNQIQKIKNLEFVLSKAISESFKKEMTHTLSEFGYFKKIFTIKDGKRVGDIEFVPDSTLEKKISMKHKNYKLKVLKNKKLVKIVTLFISIPLIILIILGIVSFVFRNDIDRSIKNWQTKIALEKLKRQKEEEEKNKDATTDELIVKKVIKDGTTDVVVTDKIDLKEKDTYYTEEKDLIVKARVKNDTDLKEGEYTEEIVEINGKKYKKINYIIKKGDTLWDISKKFLNNAFLWPFIHNMNKYIINPDIIEIRDPLVIYIELKE